MKINIASGGRQSRIALILLGLVVLVLVLSFLPWLIPEYQLTRLNDIWIAILVAGSLCLLTGKAGQVSLGSAAFVGLGAYTAVFINLEFQAGFLVALVAGAAVSAIAGLLVGIPSLRFRGFYLALTTLAFQFALTFIGTDYQEHVAAGGSFSLGTAQIFSLQLLTEKSWYFFLEIAVAVSLFIMWNLSRSKMGRAWISIRDHEIPSGVLGIHASRYKLAAFVISSAFAGMAGVITAYNLGVVDYSQFTIDVTVTYVAMIIIGGIDSLVGAVIGAIIVTELPYFLQSLGSSFGSSAGTKVFDLETLAYGLIIVVFLIFAPTGLVGIAKQLAARVRRRVVRPGNASTETASLKRDPPGADPTGGASETYVEQVASG
jgi:branched-chain amino acid transport system permease protein